eukprot:343670-Chlamydomonas_euryale.AAC.1
MLIYSPPQKTEHTPVPSTRTRLDVGVVSADDPQPQVFPRQRRHDLLLVAPDVLNLPEVGLVREFRDGVLPHECHSAWVSDLYME